MNIVFLSLSSIACVGKQKVVLYLKNGKTLEKTFPSDIKTLNLQGMGVKRVEGLNHYKKLEFLDLSRNALTAIPKINRLKRLKRLHLNQNKISKIQGLENCTSLEELNLSNNPKIRKIAGLEGLKNLKIVGLMGIRFRWSQRKEAKARYPYVKKFYFTRFPKKDD